MIPLCLRGKRRRFRYAKEETVGQNKMRSEDCVALGLLIHHSAENGWTFRALNEQPSGGLNDKGFAGRSLARLRLCFVSRIGRSIAAPAAGAELSAGPITAP